MTQVTPSINHPYKKHAEVDKHAKSVAAKNNIKQQARLAAQTQAFLNAGGSVQVLPGFPEKVLSKMAMSHVVGY